MRPQLRLFLFVLVMTSSVIQLRCGFEPCYECGSYYKFGERFPRFDLCGMCRCERGPRGQGVVRCNPRPSCIGYCYYKDKKYPSDQTFQVDGRCVSCNCDRGNTQVIKACGGIIFCKSVRYCS